MSILEDIDKVSFSKSVRNELLFPSKFNDINSTFKDFNNALAETVKGNLKLLSEIPIAPHLERDEVQSFMENRISCALKEDSLFEDGFTLSRYTEDMFKHHISYFNNIYNYDEKLKKSLYGTIFGVSKMFLNSDLPLSFLNSISDAVLTEVDYINIFEKRIKDERLQLLVSRNNIRKFKQVCDAHNSWIEDFEEVLDSIEDTRVKLIWYVDINCSQTISEIFQEKTIKKSMLDQEPFFSFILELQRITRKLEQISSSLAKGFRPFLSYDNVAAKTLSTIVRILQE